MPSCRVLSYLTLRRPLNSDAPFQSQASVACEIQSQSCIQGKRAGGQKLVFGLPFQVTLHTERVYGVNSTQAVAQEFRGRIAETLLHAKEGTGSRQEAMV